MKQECEYLFCFEEASSRLTVPKHKPRMCMCEKHTSEMLEWAAPWRDVLGAITIEPVQ